MSRAELATLSSAELFDYFTKNARANKDAPNPNWRYFIRFGSKTLYAADTYELRKKFDAAVKAQAAQAKRSAK